MFRRSAPSPQPAVQWGQVQLLELRQLRRADWHALYALYRDPELARLNAAEPTRIPRWMFRLLLLAEQGHERMSFGVMVGGHLVGNAELYGFGPARPAQPTRATLGVMLARSSWGQGYGQDTLNALLAWGFGAVPGSPDPALERIRLSTLGSNQRAQTAFRRVGFEEKGRFEQRGHTEVNMELRREDWLARHPDSVSSVPAASSSPLAPSPIGGPS
ncbi:GNAT family N-acetyltransferase [Deinococcus piscis]|uniref:GNAT family N-acetyltransferase n=1 Tax=Deinococcus piscis TaxID=394230 RepID=UPI001E4AA85F|nr:GNAT family protein [Deinococcus piscis]